MLRYILLVWVAILCTLSLALPRAENKVVHITPARDTVVQFHRGAVGLWRQNATTGEPILVTAFEMPWGALWGLTVFLAGLIGLYNARRTRTLAPNTNNDG